MKLHFDTTRWSCKPLDALFPLAVILTGLTKRPAFVALRALSTQLNAMDATAWCCVLGLPSVAGTVTA